MKAPIERDSAGEAEFRECYLDAAFEGRKGAHLWVVSTADGQRLAEYPLESLPVFDGLIASGGRLLLATVDGNVTCWAGPVSR